MKQLISELKDLTLAYKAALNYDFCPSPGEAVNLISDYPGFGDDLNNLERVLGVYEGSSPADLRSDVFSLITELEAPKHPSITVPEFRGILETATYDQTCEDPAYEGLTILRQYGNLVLQYARTGVIYSFGASELIDLGITREAIMSLGSLGWYIDEDGDLACEM